MIKMRVRFAAHVARIREDKEKCMQDFFGGGGKPEGKRLYGRLRDRWENIKLI
jgi:hypothetical protein